MKRIFLQHQDLSESDLNGSDFSESNMANAKFVGANLAGSKFHNVRLYMATFSSCDLSNAVFKEADLSGADLSLTNLKFTTFADTNLAGCKWQFESFSTRVFEAFSVEKPKRFLGCRVDSAYGNERFKKAVREEAYIEEVTQAHPLGYKLWLLSSDCGRSIRIWSLWSILFAFVFAWIIFKIGLAGFAFDEQVTALIKGGDFWSFLYYSTVTFTGFGDISPVTGLAMLVVVSEVIIGFVMLGLLVSIFANKVASRS